MNQLANVNPDENFDAGESVETESKPQAEVAEEVAKILESGPLKQQPVAKIQQRPRELQAQEGGVLIGTSLEDQYRLAQYYHKSGLMPRALNTPEKVLVALQLCHELKLPPMSSIGKICVINQTPSIFGELPLALVMRSGLLVKIKEGQITNEKGEVIGAECFVTRRDFGEVRREFTLEDAKRAGLLSKDPWKNYTRRMLQFRARTWALRDLFPDVLMGVSVLEYDHDAIEVEGRVVGSDRSSGGLAAELNKAYLEDKTNKEQSGS